MGEARIGGLTTWVARPLRALTGTQRVWLITLALCVLGIALAMPTVRDAAPRALSVPVPWPLIAVAFYLVESRVVHLHIGRSAHSLSMAEIPLLFGVFFVEPVWFIIARLLGGGAALAFARRQPAPKLAFNLALFFAGSVVAIEVVHVLAGTGGASFGPLEWGVAFLAMTAESIVSVFAIACAISVAEGRPQFHRVPEMIRTGQLISLTNTSLAILVIVVLAHEPIATVLFVIPVVIAFVAYRAYVAQRLQKEGLEMLYESTRILQRSPQVDVAMAALLQHAREMFRADLAELTLLPSRDGDELLRTSVRGREEDASMRPVGSTVDDPLLRRALDERRAVLQPEASPGEQSRFRNAMVAPLIGEHRLMGVLAVANRLSDISTFDATDLRLFETLANHIAVALENGQLEQSLHRLSELKEELHHQANHDPLTGLANRALFARALAGRLEAADLADRVAVMLFLDLDDFKLVNDTRGHAVGDALLRAVAGRISSLVRDEDVAARLGGDEFAAVLWDRDDLAASRRLARRLLASFEEPFSIEGSLVSVHASVGLAAASSPDITPDDLMRNADVAMYVAKANGKGRVAVFEPSMATDLAYRAETAQALRRAVADGELVLHYQPVFDLADSHVVGTEALVRWDRPGKGLVGPLEFIGLAEQSSLIIDVGSWVLRAALEQLREWDRLGEPFRSWWMSVNVSARQLEHPEFVDEVERRLREAGVQPHRLALEVTESALIPNAEESIERLEALRSLGVHLFIDDFGTGYSALGYLRRFPVGTLKIAREFIDVDASSTGGWGLAAAIIAMAGTLELDVIAEGVEETAQLERLRELGCAKAQGYLLARPLTATTITERFGRGIGAGPAGEPAAPDRSRAARLAEAGAMHAGTTPDFQPTVGRAVGS